MRLLAERFSRSLLAFLAPLFALVAVAFTSRLTSWLALPLGCLGPDVGERWSPNG